MKEKKNMKEKKEEYIKITREDLERRFKEYNEKYFDGILPKCRMSVNASQGGYGCYVAPDGKVPMIYMCKSVYWTDESLKLILIHEMVHHYVSSVIKPKFYTFPHGYLFRKKCKELKKKYGLKVGLHDIDNPPFKNEILPTTWLGKLRREYFGPKLKRR